MSKLMSYGLTWDEARRVSYPEMLVITAQVEHDAQIETINALLHEWRSPHMGEPEGDEKAINNLLTQQNRIEQEFNDPFNHFSLQRHKKRLERAKREAK